MRDTGELLHVTLYCNDVLAFARQFLELSGLGARREAPRSLVQLQQVGYEEELGLERRNLNFLTGSFFNAFQAVKDVQESLTRWPTVTCCAMRSWAWSMDWSLACSTARRPTAM